MPITTKLQPLFVWLLTNALPFNLLASDTPLVVWKQLISCLMYLQLFQLDRFSVSGFTAELRIIKSLIHLVISVSAVLALIALAIIGLSPVRVAYALVAYIGFLPFVLLPLACLKANRELFLIRMFALLGVFSGLGLIIDYTTDLFGLLSSILGGFLPFELWSERYAYGLKRATFFFESPSNILPIMSLCLMCLFILWFKSERVMERVLCALGVSIVMVGLFLTQTRAQWLLGGLFIVFALFIGVSSGSRKNALSVFLISILMLSVVAVGSSLFFQTSDSQSEYVFERIDSLLFFDPEDQSVRLSRWQDGLNLFTSPSVYSILGYGIGTTMGQVADGFAAQSHFESSFFQAFYEGGLLGLIIRYLPWLVALWFLVRQRKRRSLFRRLLYLWLVIYFFSVLVAPTAGAYHAQISYFVVLSLSATAVQFEIALDGRKHELMA